MPITTFTKDDLAPLVRQLVKDKLDASGTLRLLHLKRLGSNPLEIDHRNSFLLEFSASAGSPPYRMLVCFRQFDLLDYGIQAKVARALELLAANYGVFWTTEEYTSDQLQFLKKQSIDMLFVPLNEPDRRRSHQIPDFVHLADFKYYDILYLNLLCNEIVKRLRKKFHFVLSEVAASSYESYGTYATKSVMSFEDELLSSVLKEFLRDHKGHLAIDVGCGDGRHSRALARNFEKVIAFDLSQAMIEAAKKKSQGNGGGERLNNITYYVSDFEYEPLPEEDDIVGRVDFVCASFGMPSFIEDTVGMLRRFHKWLRPQGRALLTFYNSASLSNSVITPWTDRALSAQLDLVRNALEVELSPGMTFSIYCRTLDEKILEMLKGTFSVEEVHHYPHLLGILPPSIFGSDESPNDVARNFFAGMDRVVATDPKFNRSHYVFVVLKKGHQPRQGYVSVIAHLEKHSIEDYEIEPHSEIISTREVQELLDLPHEAMLKTVVFTAEDHMVVVALQANRQVDTHRLAEATGLSLDTLVLAPPSEILRRLGFPIGGISPFGLPDDVQVIVDSGCREIDHEHVFTGCGDSTKTLRLRREDFYRLIGHYELASISTKPSVND